MARSREALKAALMGGGLTEAQAEMAVTKLLTERAAAASTEKHVHKFYARVYGWIRSEKTVQYTRVHYVTLDGTFFCAQMDSGKFDRLVDEGILNAARGAVYSVNFTEKAPAGASELPLWNDDTGEMTLVRFPLVKGFTFDCGNTPNA